MNELQLHFDAVWRDPFEKAKALALVDHVQEEKNVPRRSALKMVARHRVKSRLQATQDRAAMYLNAHHKISARLKACIRDAANYPNLQSYVFLVAGWKAPTFKAHPGGVNALVGWASSSILVGARWVLQVVRCVNLYQQGLAAEALLRLPYPARACMLLNARPRRRRS